MITGHCSGSNFIIVSCEYCFWSFEVSGYFKKEKKKEKKKETESRARTLTYRTRHEGRVKDFEKNKKVEYVNKNLTPIMVSKAFIFMLFM